MLASQSAPFFSSTESSLLPFFAAKFLPVAYGIQKIQISCVVEDDKIGTDFLEEKITEFEDYVSTISRLH